MAENVIKAALKCATTVKVDPKSIKTQTNKIIKKIKEAMATKKALLGIEKDSAKLLDGRIEALEGEKKILAITSSAAVSKNGKTLAYKRLSMEPLKWRNTQGYPKLALFDVDSPLFEIQVVQDGWNGTVRFTKPSLPAPLKALYEDVKKKLEQGVRRSGGSSATLKARYNGILPEKIRNRIVSEKKNFKNIYILAEVQKWELNEEMPPRPADPLVVGFDGVQLWLLDSFDLTPAEKYVADEFAV